MNLLHLAIVALIATPAFAQKSTPTVEKVLEFFQTEAYLEQAQKCMDDALTRRRKEVTITDKRMQNIANLADRIYPASNLYKIFKLTYAKATTIENMTAIYNWQQTPKAIKYRQGLAAAFKAAPTTREAYQKKMAGIMLKPNRVNALQTFMENFEQDQTVALMHSECDFGIRMALNGYAEPAARDKVKYMKEKVQEKRSGYLEKAQEELKIFNFYALKDLKNEEVDELSKFATSALGQGHTKAFAKALEVTMDGAAKTLYEQIIKPTK